MPVRLYSRKPKVREIQTHHMRWLWAAYNYGDFSELFDKGLTDEAFSEAMFDVISSADYGWVVEAWGEEGVRPVGLVLGAARAAGRAVEPHITWFSWATPRNKLEGMAVFLRDVAKTLKIFVYSDEVDSHFWQWFRRRRMLVGGGRIIDYFSRGEHAQFYFTVGP